MSSVVCGRMITALCLFVAVESVGGALEAEKSKRMKSESMDRVDRYTIHVYNTRVNIDSYRALVKNLVLGYVHTTDAKKPEVLQLMGKILGFTEDELLGAMGRGRGKGWLFGLWSGPPTQSQQVNTILYKIAHYNIHCFVVVLVSTFHQVSRERVFS